ncbi:hypothetical protein Anas_14702, partial [Armadillidium nasatum]
VKLVIGRLLYKVNVLITLRRHSPLIRVLFGSFILEFSHIYFYIKVLENIDESDYIDDLKIN